MAGAVVQAIPQLRKVCYIYRGTRIAGPRHQFVSYTLISSRPTGFSPASHTLPSYYATPPPPTQFER